MLSVAFDPVHSLTRCYVAGALEFAPVARAAQRLFEEHRTATTTNTLFIIADPTAVESLSALRVLQPLLVHWAEAQRGGCWAIVLPNETSRALAEMTMSELRLSVSKVACFTATIEAEQWLASALP